LVFVTNSDNGFRRNHLNIIVCIKQVLDPQTPPAKFAIDSGKKEVIPPEGIPPVINPYDAQALELALRLKEKNGGKITALTAGAKVNDSIIKFALSMGSDDGYLISDASFEGSDSFGTAYILTKAIQKIATFDLVLCGRQAADWDEGIVGSLIAEHLKLPLITLAKAIEVSGPELKVSRIILSGSQIFTTTMPAVITVSNEVGQPRLPTGWGIISAARKQVPVWHAQDIGVDYGYVGATAARRKVDALSLLERSRNCEMVTGPTVEEAAVKLADRLRQSMAI
jgi:electron transfer flavoprotein beta subunit